METINKGLKEKKSNMEFAFNEQEKEALNFLKLNSNFTKEDLKEKYNDSYADESMRMEVEKNIVILHFYLYKKEEFSKAITKYYPNYISKEKFGTFTFEHYNIIENKKDNAVYVEELIACTKMMFEVEELEKKLVHAKSREEIKRYVTDFNAAAVLLTDKDLGAKIEPYEEYVERRKKEIYADEELRKIAAELKESGKIIQENHNERKKYFFDGCETASKEELLKAFKELGNDEKYVKRNSEIYKKMTSFYGQMIVSKNIEYVRKSYADIVDDILKEYEKNKSKNNFNYSPDNNTPTINGDDDGELTNDPNKGKGLN